MKRTICILLSVLFSLSCAAQTGLLLKTVVIDPGHGGKDPGAVSPDKKSYEKTFTLDISKKLAQRIRDEFPDVKVVMTRDSDTFPKLEQRASIANNADADLFISIHINSARSTSASGFSVHVLGQSSNKDRDLFASNMEICQRENSVISLEDDYEQRYQGFDPSDPASYIFMQLMQNSNLESSIHFAELVDRELRGGSISKDRGVSQNPFLVLWMTSMPSVLVEMGFISNSADLAALRKEANRSDMAERLFKAFCSYKEDYEGSARTRDLQVRQETAVEKTPAVRYGIQVMSGSAVVDDRHPSFVGYKPERIKVGNVYKYIIAVSENIDKTREALPEARAKNPGCFIVRISPENEILPYKSGSVKQ